MAIYSLAVRTTNTTINNAALEIRTAATNRPKLMELGISQNTGTAVSWGFGRPAAIGVTPVNTPFLAEDAGDPSAITNASLSWGTSPTAPTAYHRRLSTPASVGAGVIWTFPRGFPIQVSSSVVVFNITASVASDMWAVVDE